MLHFWVCFVESTKIYLLGFAKHTHCVARLTVRFLSCHTSASGEHPVIGGGRESEVAGVRGFAKTSKLKMEGLIVKDSTDTQHRDWPITGWVSGCCASKAQGWRGLVLDSSAYSKLLLR